MIVLVQANVLTVGLDGKSQEVLQELPIRVLSMRSGAEAARSLKNEEVNGIISKWDLEDMADGRFLKRLKSVKPDIPTIVFINSGDTSQEIAARSLGVSAVLTANASDELFLDTVANVFGLKGIVSIRAVSAVRATRSQYQKTAGNRARR